MRPIGFLHTSAVHVPTFEALVDELAPGNPTTVVVDESLLATARRLGPAHDVVRAGIGNALAQLRNAGAGLVVCTCSTIGGEAELVGEHHGLEVVRVDRPMADAAVACGPRIGVVAALESTLGPTRELLASCADAAGATVQISEHLVPGAWDRFEAGDGDGYLAAIADALAGLDRSCDVIVLAQASMAAASERVHLSVPVLSSPRLAVAHAIAAIRATG